MACLRGEWDACLEIENMEKTCHESDHKHDVCRVMIDCNTPAITETCDAPHGEMEDMDPDMERPHHYGDSPQPYHPPYDPHYGYHGEMDPYHGYHYG